MSFPEDTALTNNNAPANNYAYQAIDALWLLHESFMLRVEKLNSALEKGTINNKQYNDWLSCLQDIKAGWLMHEIATPDDVLLLQLLAQHNMQDAIEFAVA